MIETHYHLLFDTDDGPKSIEESLQLAEASIGEGVTHIVCTPHANTKYAFDPDRNNRRLEELRQHLGNRIALGIGCDFHLSDENIENFSRNPLQYTINRGQYLLIELSDFGISQTVTAVLERLIGSGFIPIVTHPERNSTIISAPSRLIEWIRCGCLVQITAGSLTGRFGKAAEACALQLLKQQRVHLIASDAHSIDRRPPALKVAFDRVAQSFGLDTAEYLCVRNPAAVFKGEPISAKVEKSKPAHQRSTKMTSKFSWMPWR